MVFAAPEEYEEVAQGLANLEAVGATVLVGVAMTPDNHSFLLAKVQLGDEGSLDVSTEDDARAGEPLPRQSLSLAHKLQQLASQLVR